MSVDNLGVLFEQLLRFDHRAVVVTLPQPTILN